MKLASSILVLVALFALPTSAHAQPICTDGSPGSTHCNNDASPFPAPSSTGSTGDSAPAPAPVPAYKTRVRTHDFFLPNGRLTPRGRTSLRVDGFGVFDTISYGLHDRIEISASAPVIPVVTVLGVRVGLTRPESALQVTLGGSVWVPLADDSNDERYYLTQPSATIGYRQNGLEVHATLTALYERTDELLIPGGNIGFSVQASERSRFHLNYASINLNRFTSQQDPRLNLLIAGIKYAGFQWDMDFGVFVPTNVDDSGETFPVPFISLQRLY